MGVSRSPQLRLIKAGGLQTLGLIGGAGISKEGRRGTIGSANPALGSTASTDMSIPAKRVQLRS
jgi:hypothetical protein